MAAANQPSFGQGPTPGAQSRMLAPQIATQQSTPGQPQMMSSPTKNVNTASLCRLGQETVQDIVAKMTDIFQFLRNIQLPNNVNASVANFQEKKAKLDESIRQLTTNFKKLRLIYEKVNEHTIPLDTGPVEGLLPIEEDGEVKGQTAQMTEQLKYATEEQKEIIEQIQARNQQLKEIIDQLRTVIWEINTMMAMRKI